MTTDSEVRRSQRAPKPNEKMKKYLSEVQKSQKNSPELFEKTYNTWKIGAKNTRQRLKENLGDEALVTLTDSIESLHQCVVTAYEDLDFKDINQVIRRKMDACSATTKNVIELLNLRLGESGDEWNDDEQKARLRLMLDTEYAKSIFSTSSSHQNSFRQSKSESSHASSDTLSDKRAEVRAKLAAKEVEMKTLQQKADLELQLRELETKKDIDMARAMVAAYDEEIDRSQTVPKVKMVETTTPELSRIDHHEKITTDGFSALAESLRTNRLPIPEPPVFNGDPLQYTTWVGAFDTLIDSKGIPSSEKIHYLNKYVTGKAKAVVQGFFMLRSDEAYKKAREVLEKRYGNNFIITDQIQRKLESWPRISPRDSSGLQDFSDFLESTLIATQSIKELNILNDMREIGKLSSKLPDYMSTRWKRNSMRTKDNEGRYPNLNEFVDFVKKEAELANDPVLNSRGRTTTDLNQKGTKSHSQAFVTNSAEHPESPITKELETKPHVQAFVTSAEQSDSPKTKNCVFCSSTNHYLPNCESFAKELHENKIKFIKEEKRCFKCLRIGHGSKSCPNPHKCKTCNNKHPTCLHDDKRTTQPKQRDSKTVQQVNCARAIARKHLSSTTAIVPVWVSSERAPDKERLVYALLDSGSDTTFMDQSLAKDIQAPKDNTRLRIGTIGDSNPVPVACERVTSLRVRGYAGSKYVSLPPVYTIPEIPMRDSSTPTMQTAAPWPHLHPIISELPPPLEQTIDMLIGYDCSQAFIPRETIIGKDDEPFAMKTDLGWTIIGPSLQGATPNSTSCHRITTKELPAMRPEDACKILEKDFTDGNSSETTSQEDMAFLQVLKESIRVDISGHLEMPLPFKQDEPNMPNNYFQASKRLEHLKNKLKRDEKYKKEYTAFMEEIIDRGDAEEAPERADKEWYIPHHGVYHPQKGKLRVVFDCSARYGNTSLNDHLLAGPPLMNDLIGILLRFRRHTVAFTCDVEKMFHQFHVAPRHRDYLRFLWWKNGDWTLEPTVFRMKVHLFGATSSPGCANYGLKYLARKNADKYPEGAKFVQEDFYVDDGLCSLPSEKEASDLINQAIELCKEGKLRLHKFISNKLEALQNLPNSELAQKIQSQDLSFEESPVERALGVKWSIGTDTLSFSFTSKERPITRRGILATVASIYDPLGLVAPFVLTGKRILQEVCDKGTGWDDPVTPNIVARWESWMSDMRKLGDIAIPRCYTPTGLKQTDRVELHHFADASQKGYGVCSYIRTISNSGEINCALVTAKARVAPRKTTSIPRLELTAALVAAQMSVVVKEQLKIEIEKEHFWTDSKIVLGYIANETKQFHVFVANRVQKIKDITYQSQWHHVSGVDNPADHASRGLNMDQLKQSNWFTGPRWLWSPDVIYPSDFSPELYPNDPEVRVNLKTQCTDVSLDLDDRLKHLSQWSTVTRVIARIKRLRNKDICPELPLSPEEICDAALSVIRSIQLQFLPAEYTLLAKGKPILGAALAHAEPFLHKGVMRVGGRVKDHSTPFEEAHPLILPKCHTTTIIISYCHAQIKHQGRGMTLNELRSRGFWVIGGSKQVANLLRNCVTCRKLRGAPQEQRMADLPKERTEPSPPFTFVGMDCFGPILVKNGRREMKRYGLLLTCLCSRAIHLEMLDDMSTDAFINAFRCFIAIRGSVQRVFCDQGSNFVGASNEFRDAAQKTVKEGLSQAFRNETEFIFNPPHASHAGGVWERQIRTARSILAATLALHSGRLDDSSLRTFLYETMAIVNSRPITTLHQGDPTSPQPLTPNNILTMKSKAALQPPPGIFTKEDVFLRKRWRRVQYLLEQFWARWRREYIASINRQKWRTPRRNLTAGDIVLLADSTPRNQWQLGRIVAATASSDGLVRKAKVAVASNTKDGKRDLTILERPIQKLVLILESD